MAINNWIGVTSTDISVTNNWSAGAFPGTGDTAVWGTITPYAMASGTAANAITNLIITDGAGTQSMGTAGGTCSWGNITGYVQIANRAPAHWISSSGTVALVKLECPVRNTIYLTTGTFTTVQATNLTCEIVAAAIVTNVLFTGATINAAGNGTAITLAQGTGTMNLTNRNVTTCKVGAGSTVVLKGSSIVATTGDFQQSTLVMQSSGTLPTSTLVAGISLFAGSLLTFAGNPNSTAAGGTVVVYPGANVMDVVPGCTVTITKLAAGPTTSTPAGGGPVG